MNKDQRTALYALSVLAHGKNDAYTKAAVAIVDRMLALGADKCPNEHSGSCDCISSPCLGYSKSAPNGVSPNLVEIMDGVGDTTFQLTPQEAGDFVRDAMSLEDRPAVLVIKDCTL